MLKCHVQFIEVGKTLRVISDENYDLTTGSGLPMKGDIVWLFDKTRSKQFWVVERHWHIGNIIGVITIYVAPTSEQARTICE